MRWVVRVVPQAERRVLVGCQRAVCVVLDTLGPAQDTDVEVEDRPRIPPRPHDREESSCAENNKGNPQESENDVVRDRQQPFDCPQPPGERGIKLGIDP
jgi:hypothetical protein